MASSASRAIARPVTNASAARTDPPADDIVSAADRFARLSAIKEAWSKAEPEYKQLQALFREVAGDRDMRFPTSDGSAEVAVEQKPDTVCRKVEPDLIPLAVKLSGNFLFDVHTLHPSKGSERNFLLNAYTLLPKRQAEELDGAYKVACTPHVRLLRESGSDRR